MSHTARRARSGTSSARSKLCSNAGSVRLPLVTDVPPPSITVGRRQAAAKQGRRSLYPELTPSSHTSQVDGPRRSSIIVVLLLSGLFLSATALYVFLHMVASSSASRGPRPVSPLPICNFTRWVALTGTPECRTVPRKIFAKNGTVADAAVAAMLCVCVALPHACGLGGGFLAIYYNRRESSVSTIDAQNVAPMQATEQLYATKRNDTLIGGLSIAVPGQLKGYQKLLERAGSRVPWKTLFEDAITLARKGVPAHDDLVEELNRQETRILNTAHIRELFLTNETGTLIGKNATFFNKALASTLRAIAERGPQEFYEGQVAKDMLRDINASGSVITKEDLKKYVVRTRDPEKQQLRGGWAVWSTPPPSCGLLSNFILAILDQFRNRTGGLDDSDLTAHRMIEAFKFAFALRTELGDPLYNDITKAVQNTTRREALKAIAEKIKSTPYKDLLEYGLHYEYISVHGSRQIAILGPSGDGIVMVSSLNTDFGSLVMSPSTGVIFNNGMDDFSLMGRSNYYNLVPTRYNTIRQSKRPLSSLGPSIVTDSKGELVVLAGSTGGPTATTGLVQVLMRVLWMGHTIKEAIDCGRLHHQLLPRFILGESTVDADVLDGLKRRGHEFHDTEWRGTVQGIVRLPDGRVYAAADNRRGAAGCDGE